MQVQSDRNWVEAIGKVDYVAHTGFVIIKIGSVLKSHMTYSVGTQKCVRWTTQIYGSQRCGPAMVCYSQNLSWSMLNDKVKFWERNFVEGSDWKGCIWSIFIFVWFREIIYFIACSLHMTACTVHVKQWWQVLNSFDNFERKCTL